MHGQLAQIIVEGWIDASMDFLHPAIANPLFAKDFLLSFERQSVEFGASQSYDDLDRLAEGVCTRVCFGMGKKPRHAAVEQVTVGGVEQCSGGDEGRGNTTAQLDQQFAHGNWTVRDALPKILIPADN